MADDRREGADYTMTVKDWTALKRLMDMAEVICTKGVAALHQTSNIRSKHVTE